VPDPEEILFPSHKERFEDRRKERDQRKLLDEFFDHATLLAISRLVGRGVFDAIDYPISTGKEGGVFRASAADGFRAVKVYRIGNSVFRRLPPHVMEELRRETSERNFGRLIAAWTRREHTVLRRFRDAGVRVPEPHAYVRNVLVMEFVGEDGNPAPRLKDAALEDPEAFYADFLEQVRRMVEVSGWVHGDLSPYNVLVRADRAVLIDVAQAMPGTHPQARALLERDVRHFSRYFEKLGIATSFEEFWVAVGGDRLSPPEPLAR
jgi:RIO kinase 1